LCAILQNKTEVADSTYHLVKQAYIGLYNVLHQRCISLTAIRNVKNSNWLHVKYTVEHKDIKKAREINLRFIPCLYKWCGHFTNLKYVFFCM